MNSIDLTHFSSGRKDIHPAMIVCPGGGYWRHAAHEGEPIAKWLNSIGISAFVLKYPLTPERHPAPLSALQTAIRTVRAKADEWRIDTSHVGVIGFSAGGHLTATAAIKFDGAEPDAKDPLQRFSSRPDAIVLAYPVISFREHTHEGTVVNLLGDEPSDQLRYSLSNEEHVTPETPPTFLWHTADDNVVSVNNSILFATSLSKNNVPFELHIFPHGPHGTGLAEDYPNLTIWTQLCETWLKNCGFD